MPIATRRAYDRPGPDDGYRVLIDGLWPRGLTKNELKVEEWLKGIAPSAALRKWYGHQPKKWLEFRRRFRKELREPPCREILEVLVERVRREKVTLVFAARDAEHSNARVIAELVREKLS